jgi:hypothetical protein
MTQDTPPETSPPEKTWLEHDRLRMPLPGPWTRRESPQGLSLVPEGQRDPALVIQPFIPSTELTLSEASAKIAKNFASKLGEVDEAASTKPSERTNSKGLLVSAQRLVIKRPKGNRIVAIVIVAKAPDGFQPAIVAAGTPEGAKLMARLVAGLDEMTLREAPAAPASTKIDFDRLALELPGAWTTKDEGERRVAIASGLPLALVLEKSQDYSDASANRVLALWIENGDKDAEVLEDSAPTSVTRADGLVAFAQKRVRRSKTNKDLVLHSLQVIVVAGGHFQAFSARCTEAAIASEYFPKIEKALQNIQLRLPPLDLPKHDTDSALAERAHLRLKRPVLWQLDGYRSRPDQPGLRFSLHSAEPGAGEKVRAVVDIQLNLPASPQTLLGRFLFSLLHPEPDDASRFRKNKPERIRVADGRIGADGPPALLMEIQQVSDDGKLKAKAFGLLLGGPSCYALIGLGGPEKKSDTGITAAAWPKLCRALAATAATSRWLGEVTMRPDIEAWLVARKSFDYYTSDSSYRVVGDMSISSSSSTSYKWDFGSDSMAKVQFEDKSNIFMNYNYREPLNTWNAGPSDYLGLNPSNPIVNKTSVGDYSSNPDGFKAHAPYRVASSPDGATWLVLFRPGGDTSMHRLVLSPTAFSIDDYNGGTAPGAPTGSTTELAPDLAATPIDTSAPQVLEKNLAAGESATWSISAPQGGHFQVHAECEKGDGLLELGDIAGNWVQSCDDVGASPDPKLSFALEPGAGCLLRLRSFDRAPLRAKLTITPPQSLAKQALGELTTDSYRRSLGHEETAVLLFRPKQTGVWRFSASGGLKKLELFGAEEHRIALRARYSKTETESIDQTLLAGQTYTLRISGDKDLPGESVLQVRGLAPPNPDQLPKDLRLLYFKTAAPFESETINSTTPPHGVALLRHPTTIGGELKIQAFTGAGKDGVLAYIRIYDDLGLRLHSNYNRGEHSFTIKARPSSVIFIEIHAAEPAAIPFRISLQEKGSLASRARVLESNDSASFPAGGEVVHKITAQGGMTNAQVKHRGAGNLWLEVFDENESRIDYNLSRENFELKFEATPGKIYLLRTRSESASQYEIQISALGPLASRAEALPANGAFPAFTLAPGAERVFGLKASKAFEAQLLSRSPKDHWLKFILYDANEKPIESTNLDLLSRQALSFTADATYYLVFRNLRSTPSTCEPRLLPLVPAAPAGEKLESGADFELEGFHWKLFSAPVQAGEILIRFVSLDRENPLAIDLIDESGQRIDSAFAKDGDLTLRREIPKDQSLRIRALNLSTKKARYAFSLIQRAPLAERALPLPATGMRLELRPFEDRVWRFKAPASGTLSIDTRSRSVHSLELYSPDGTKLAAEDGDWDRRDSRYEGELDFEVSAGQELILRLRNSYSEGSFTLDIQRPR